MALLWYISLIHHSGAMSWTMYYSKTQQQPESSQNKFCVFQTYLHHMSLGSFFNFSNIMVFTRDRSLQLPTHVNIPKKLSHSLPPKTLLYTHMKKMLWWLNLQSQLSPTTRICLVLHLNFVGVYPDPLLQLQHPAWPRSYVYNTTFQEKHTSSA